MFLLNTDTMIFSILLWFIEQLLRKKKGYTHFFNFQVEKFHVDTKPYVVFRQASNASVTRPTPTYGDTSDKLGARFIQVKNTSRTFFISYANVRIVRNTVRIRPGWKTAKSSNYTSQNTLVWLRHKEMCIDRKRGADMRPNFRIFIPTVPQLMDRGRDWSWY